MYYFIIEIKVQIVGIKGMGKMVKVINKYVFALSMVILMGNFTCYSMLLEYQQEQEGELSYIGKHIRFFLKDMVAMTIEDNELSLAKIAYDHSNTIMYVMQHFNDIDKILEAAGLGTYDIVEIVSKLSSYVQAINSDDLRLSPEIIEEQVRVSIDNYIDGLDFNSVIPIQSLLSEHNGIDISAYPESIQITIRDILTRYLNALPLIYKKNIIMTYLEQDPKAFDIDNIVVVMTEVGPIVQKLFQLIGQNSTSVVFRNAMQKLQTQLKTVPLEISKSILRDALGSDFARFEHAEFKNLGAASIAQAILVTTPDNEEFVVKVRKPGIVDRVAEEYDVLMTKVLSTDEGKHMVGQIYHNIEEELDFTEEAKHLLRGSQVYQACEGSGVITTPLIPSGNFIHSHVLVMTKAAGSPLSRFISKSEQQTKLIALYLFYFIWLREALFGSGFFHGDTHAGNIFLDIKNATTHSFVLTPIDFGACGQLSKEQQMSMILLMVGLEFNLVDFVDAAIQKLSSGSYDSEKFIAQLQNLFGSDGVSSPTEVNAQVMAYLKILMAKGDQAWTMAEKRTAFFIVQYLIKILKNIKQAEDTKSKYTAFMEILDECKVRMPESFTLFVRGKTFIEQQIAEILKNQNLDSVAFYKKLFSRLQGSIIPEDVILGLMNTFSKTMIINILMSTLRAKFTGDGCAIL